MLALLLACTQSPPPAQSTAAPKAPLPVSRATVEQHSEAFSRFAGRWRSEDDPNSEVVVVKTLWVDVYAGEELDRRPMELASDCRDRGGQPDPDGQYINLLGEGATCYRVLSLTPARMELSHLPRGNTLRFLRAD